MVEEANIILVIEVIVISLREGWKIFSRRSLYLKAGLILRVE
jgi:hypothetical protein